MKRIVVVSDMHCGSNTGLTPPSNQVRKAHEVTWQAYKNMLESLQPIHTLVCNGDCINAPSLRCFNEDNLEGDTDKQCQMAATALDEAKAKNLIMMAGTDSHTGHGFELERGALDKARILAYEAGRPYESTTYDIVLDYNVDGLVFNFRHYIGTRSSPMSRGLTGILDKIVAELKEARKKDRKKDILVRSHAHYYTYHGDDHSMLVVTPALQLPNANYAAKKCSGLVNWGLVYFDVYPDGQYVWKAMLGDFGLSKTKLLRAK